MRNKLANLEGKVNVEDTWEKIKYQIQNTDLDLISPCDRQKSQKVCYDEDCRRAIKKRNAARMNIINEGSEISKETYAQKRKEAKEIL